MGKNYIENSLKRFLKRKVKITLGFVVAFMISGTLGFADILVDVNEKYKDRVFTGKNEYVIDEDTIFTNTFDIKIDNKPLTERAAIFILDGATVNNYGYIDIPKTSNPNDRAVYVNSSTFNNYGNIDLKITGKNSKINNYGIIDTVQYRNGHYLNGGEFTNYGFLQAQWYLLNLQNNAIFRNYGFTRIKYGNMTEGSTSGTEENYGVIINGNGNIYTPEVNSSNYGIVIMTGDGGVKYFAKNNRGVLLKLKDGNYELRASGSGIIGDDEYKNYDGTKYETVLDLVEHLNDKDKILNSTNISQKVTIDGKDFDSKEADNIYINNSSFKLDLGKDIADNSNDNKADKLIENKAITTIYQGGGNGVVLDNDVEGNNRGDNDLTLDSTTIVGYFEKEGTLLKVDGDLTLNNSVINAVAKRNEDGSFAVDSEKVVAIEVNGKLDYTEGESHIFGTIKGGKGSVINVDGNNNPKEVNVLNEQISTSGTVNLNDGNWTKGEFGNINLGGDTSVVNIDGNLVGELMGDSSSTQTTLDEMITGKGTLNVDKIRFDLGSVDINSLDDEFTIKGNGEITLGDKEKANALDKIDTSVIFNKEIKDGNVVLTFKSAEEMGIHDPAKQKEYEQLIKNYKDHYDTINSKSAEEILELIGIINKAMEIMGTAGVKITRDIAGAFTDSINEFDKKANKGEWLTNAKYIGSDMEYDGTSTVNGYDSDINSMVGMAEYGISENTSLGFAVGGGDTDIDLKELNGKSTSLDGHNYYVGIYAKHSMNGFDMTGSFGYTISDLDVENGGSADSEAFTLAGYIKRDISLTDTIKLQPNVAFAYDYIKQDTAEMGKGMSINSGDYHIFEADMGMNIVKEIAFEKGNLELKAGIKYSMTNVDRNKEITGKYYEADVNLGSPEIDDKKGTAHIGFDYEYETGFGVNGKYETMWSDSGDDSRITAGISYRF